MGYRISWVKVTVLNFFYIKESLLTQIFVELEPEVLTQKLLLQNFEEDHSLYFTKNSFGSQNIC